MNKNVIIKNFSMKKEAAKLVLYFLCALAMGIFSIAYLYVGNYFMAGFVGLGTLSWCWLSFACIREIAVAIEWIKSSRHLSR